MITDRARKFAQDAHGIATRWDGKTPYIVHPDKVVEYLKHWRVVDQDVISAAYLHDVVEDTDITLDQIRDNFGLKVADLVSELTFPNGVTDEEYWNRCKKMSKNAALIKTADIFANLTETGGRGLGNHFRNKRLKAISLLIRE